MLSKKEMTSTDYKLLKAQLLYRLERYEESLALYRELTTSVRLGCCS